MTECTTCPVAHPSRHAHTCMYVNAPQELVSLVRALGRDPTHAATVLSLANELALRGAGVGEAISVVMATQGWLEGDRAGPERETRYALMRPVTAMLGPGLARGCEQVATDQLAALVKMYGTSGYVRDSVVRVVVNELAARMDQGARLQDPPALWAAVADLADAHQAVATKGLYVKATLRGLRSVQRLGRTLVADAAEHLEHTSAEGLASLAGLMAASGAWDDNIAAHIVREAGHALATPGGMGIASLVRLTEGLVRGHVDCGGQLPEKLLRHARYYANKHAANESPQVQIHVTALSASVATRLLTCIM